MYIPEGYGAVFPYMMVERAAEFVIFLENTFGATEIGRTELADGRLANVRIRIGTSTFMVSQPDGDQTKPMPGAYYVYVENVDRTMARALSNGATRLFDAMDMPYKDRQGGIRDPFRNIWWVSRRLVEEPYDG